MVRSSTIKHDFCLINLTCTGFTYGPADFCSSYMYTKIIKHSCILYTLTHLDRLASKKFELLTNKHLYNSYKNNGRCNI